MAHPIKMKEAVIQKCLLGNKQQHEIAREYGIGRSTIGKWLKQCKHKGGTVLKSNEKRPKDWSAEERITALIEAGTMTTSEALATWCRKKGIFPHNLQQWRVDAISGMTGNLNKNQNAIEKSLKNEILSLKKDLNRKDKALAETAALLVLKKKVQEIWGEPEGD
jgi:transposase-like protein